MNRAQVILVGGGVFGLGGLGFLLLKASGVEGFSTGIATSALRIFPARVSARAAFLD